MQLAWAGFGIAAAPIGAVAEIVGLRPTIVSMGVITFSVVVLYGTSLSGVFVRTAE
jgi:hypothetical protein